MNQEESRAKISVIIPCLNYWEFLLDAVASIEACLEPIYEIICLIEEEQDPATLDIFTYLQSQGYQILRVPQLTDLVDRFNLGIAQSNTPYILPLLPQDKIKSDYLSEAINILDHCLEIDGVYSYVEIENQGIKTASVDQKQTFNSDYLPISVIFRQEIWAKWGKLKQRVPGQNIYYWNFGLGADKTDLKFYHIPKTFFYRREWPGEVHQNFGSSLNLSKVDSYPLVSLCIPTHNGSQFLAEAITSALSQTYPNLEMIIADDGSQDQTLQIANLFQQHSRLPFKIFSHHQSGLANNCNFCIQESQGQWIKFLFQDDILKPNCIEEMVKLAIQDFEIGLVFSPREMILPPNFEQDKNLLAIYRNINHVEQYWSVLQPIQPGQNLFTDPAIFHYPINKIGEPSNVLLSRPILDQVGRFDPQLNQLVDLDLWWRIMAQSKIGFVHQTLSYFRIHPQQQTYRNVKAGVAGDVNFYQKISCDSIYHFLPSEFRQGAFLIYVILLNENYLKQRDLSTTLPELQKIRRELAQTWLNTDLDQLQPLYRGYRGTLQRLLMRNGFYREPLPSSDLEFCQQLTSRFTQGLGDPRPILAAMLYYPSEELAQFAKLYPIPNWFTKDLRKWLKVQTNN